MTSDYDEKWDAWMDAQTPSERRRVLRAMNTSPVAPAAVDSQTKSILKAVATGVVVSILLVVAFIAICLFKVCDFLLQKIIPGYVSLDRYIIPQDDQEDRVGRI